MSRLTIKQEVLQKLYEAWFHQRGHESFEAMCEKKGLDDITFCDIITMMAREGLIRPRTLDSYEITPYGVRDAEESKVVDEELLQENKSARRTIRNILLRESNPLAAIPVERLADKAGLQSTLLGRHLQVLEGWGYVHGNGAIKLTPQGARSMDWD
ncbi:MAG: hypothetical protein GX552_04135 [Chloroflexi bacterium]|nr:hypothetical protein [Chloroflexota bacterium]